MGRIRFVTGALILWLSLWTSPTVQAYPNYHDPNLDDQGYCSACHPGFGAGRSDSLHAMHTGNPDPVTGNCDLCHTGSGRGNPFVMWSVNDNLGCVGCHGRDYGETIQLPNNYDNGTGNLFNLNGKPKASGYGLRLHHANHGVEICATCHPDTSIPGGAILGEDVDPPYYARGDVSLGDMAVDSCTNEDTANTETLGDDEVGLDNDGDDLYDGSDCDCKAVCTPGETGDPLANPLVVTSHDAQSGTLNFSYGVACEATENRIAYGPLDAVSTYGYAGQACDIGNAGSASWTYPPGSLFFVVVGNTATHEGSYGASSAGMERLQVGPTAEVCPLPQQLADRCDP